MAFEQFFQKIRDAFAHLLKQPSQNSGLSESETHLEEAIFASISQENTPEQLKIPDVEKLIPIQKNQTNIDLRPIIPQRVDTQFVVKLDDFQLKISTTTKSDKANKSPTSDSNCWVPEGHSIQVAGRSIPGGLLYVGTKLKIVSEQAYSYDLSEPALINPTLTVNFRTPDYTGQNMSYWPNYAHLNPTSRAAYLEWLISGRSDPNAYIGYVFLFFYGLERRVFHDVKTSADAKAEIPILLNEVERLLQIYGANRSFSSYACSFLQAVRLQHGLELPEPVLEDFYPEVFPLGLKLALAQKAVREEPIPVDLAYAWVTRMQRWGTAFDRCQIAIRALFTQRFAEHYGEGLIVKPNKTAIKLEYRPASQSLNRAIPILKEHLPDLTALSGKPIKGVLELLTSCVQSFEAYSRYLGRNPDAVDSLKAKALLPAEVLRTDSSLQPLQAFLEQKLIENAYAEVSFSELNTIMVYSLPDKPDKTEALALAQLLEKLGVGLEPDIRFGTGKPQLNETVILFKLVDKAPVEPSPAFSTALSVLHLAVMVSASDGHIAHQERAHFQQHIETILGLSPSEKMRLHASGKWLETQSGQSTTGFKKRLESFDLKQRQELAHFLIMIANADGRIDPAEIKILKKIYTLLGLDSEKVYSDIHVHQTAEMEPVLVQQAQTSLGHTIPKTVDRSESATFKLDLALVEKKLQQTQEVQNLLQTIFDDTAKPEDSKQETLISAPEEVQVILLKGFDARHSALLRDLLSRESWERSMFETLCQSHRLMAEGVLESINDVCFQLYDDALLEDEDDTITLNPELIKEFAL